MKKNARRKVLSYKIIYENFMKEVTAQLWWKLH